MYIIVFFSLFALLLTYCEQKGYLKWGMLSSFILLFAIAALRYNYGNDYAGYHEMYNEIIRYHFSFRRIIEERSVREFGWVLLNYLFEPIGGFYALVAFVALVQNFVYYRFIRLYLPKDEWTCAVFIYVFSTNFYILNMSMMRQGLAIALFVWSFNSIRKNDIILSLLLIGLAWSVHRSAIVLFPFVLLPFFLKKREMGSLIAIVVGLLCVLLFTNKGIVSFLFSQSMALEDIENYADYYGNNPSAVQYGLGFLLNLVPFLLLLFYLIRAKSSTLDQRMLVVLATISTLIIPFGEIVPLVGRVGMYFGAFGIVAVPLVIKWLPNRHIARGALILYIFMTLYGYLGFFHSPIWQDAYSEYHTILGII